MPEEKKGVPEITNKKSEETPKDTVEEEARNTKNFEEEHNRYKSPFLIFETTIIRLIIFGLIGIIILFALAFIGQFAFGTTGGIIGSVIGIIILIALLWASWKADEKGR